MAHELAVIVVSFFLDNYGLLSDPPPKYIQDNVNHILSEIEAGKHVPYQRKLHFHILNMKLLVLVKKTIVSNVLA